MRLTRSLGAHQVGETICESKTSSKIQINLKLQNLGTTDLLLLIFWIYISPSLHLFIVADFMQVHHLGTAVSSDFSYSDLYFFKFFLDFKVLYFFIFFSSLKGSMTFVHCRPILCRFTIWEPLWVLISHKLNPLPMHIFALKLIGSRTWSMTVMGYKSNSVNSHFHPKSDWMIKILLWRAWE